MKNRILVTAAFMLAASPAFADHRHLGVDSAVGGAIGGALGGFLGSEIGGRDGAIVGAGFGAILGTAYNTRGYYGYHYRPRHYVVREYHHYYQPRRYYRPRHYYQPRHYHHYHHHYYGHHGRSFCPPGHRKHGRCW